MRKARFVATLCVAAGFVSCKAAAPAAPRQAGPAAATPERSNPLFAASPLPYQAPPFDRIRVSDYAPAIEEGMKRQIAEIEKIAVDPQPPTFANTIEALERSGELLTRATKVFFNLVQTDADD